MRQYACVCVSIFLSIYLYLSWSIRCFSVLFPQDWVLLRCDGDLDLKAWTEFSRGNTAWTNCWWFRYLDFLCDHPMVTGTCHLFLKSPNLANDFGGPSSNWLLIEDQKCIIYFVHDFPVLITKQLLSPRNPFEMQSVLRCSMHHCSKEMSSHLGSPKHVFPAAQ